MIRRITLLLTVALAAGVAPANDSNVSSVGSAASGSTAPIIQEQVSAERAPRLLRRAPEVKAPKLGRYTVRTPELDMPGSARATVLDRVSGAKHPPESAEGPQAYPPIPPLPGPASALNYTVEVFGVDGGYAGFTGVFGVPMDIDGNFDGVPDSMLEVVGVPPTPASGVVATPASGVVFRAVVTRLVRSAPGVPQIGGVTTGVRYGLWITYFTNGGLTAHSVGFNAFEGDGAPDLVDISATITSGSVNMTVAAQAPHGPLTLFGRRWEGGHPGWPNKLTGFVRFDPIPASVSFNLGPTSAERGNATVTVMSPTHVSASFYRDDPEGANTSEHRFGLNIPTLPSFLGIAWAPDSIGEVQAKVVQLHVEGSIDPDLTYSHHILAPGGGDSIDVDAVALLRGLGGFWNIRLRIWPFPSVRVEPQPGYVTPPIGSIEVGVGIGVAAEIARVAYDYANVIFLGGGGVLISGRLAGVRNAAFLSGYGGVYELILDHTAGPLSFWYTDGSRRANGSMTLPDRLHVLIDTGSMAVELKPSSGSITNINLYLRAFSSPWFGRVMQADVSLSNIDPGTRISAAAGASSVALSLTAGTAIAVVDVKLRSDGSIYSGDVLPAGTDGVLLHDTSRYVAHVHLSGVRGLDGRKTFDSSCGRPCSKIRVSLNRNVNSNLRIDVQSTETIVVNGTGYPMVSSMLVTIDAAPRDMVIDTYTASVYGCFLIIICKDQLVGSYIAYWAGEPSGLLTLTKTDPTGNKTFVKIASLPAAPPNANALDVCMFQDGWCLRPGGIPVADIRLSGFVRAAAPLTVQELDLCIDAGCGTALHARNLTGRILNITYAEHDNGCCLPNDRWIYADTQGTGITGRLWLGTLIDASLVNVSANAKLIRLWGYVPTYLSGTLNCDPATRLYLASVPIDPALICDNL